MRKGLLPCILLFLAVTFVACDQSPESSTVEEEVYSPVDTTDVAPPVISIPFPSGDFTFVIYFGADPKRPDSTALAIAPLRNPTEFKIIFVDVLLEAPRFSPDKTKILVSGPGLWGRKMGMFDVEANQFLGYWEGNGDSQSAVWLDNQRFVYSETGHYSSIRTSIRTIGNGVEELSREVYLSGAPPIDGRMIASYQGSYGLISVSNPVLENINWINRSSPVGFNFDDYFDFNEDRKSIIGQGGVGNTMGRKRSVFKAHVDHESFVEFSDSVSLFMVAPRWAGRNYVVYTSVTDRNYSEMGSEIRYLNLWENTQGTILRAQDIPGASVIGFPDY